MKSNFFVKLKLFTVCLLCIAIGISFTACNGIGNDVKQTNNSLTVYSPFNSLGQDTNSSYIIKIYRTLYPNVEVNIIYNTWDNHETFKKKMQADILAGKGPDLIYIDWLYYKENSVDSMMNSGAFADMTPFIEADKKFDYSNYNEAAMKIGILDGKRYLMPTSFDIPMLLTTQSILDETGFNIDNCNDFWSFSNELTKYYESQTKKEHMGFSYGLLYLKNFQNVAGINVMDYSNKKTSLDSEDFKKGADFIKKIYNKTKWYDQNHDSLEGHNYLINRKKLFSDYPFIHCPETFGAQLQAGLLTNNEKPVLLPIKDINGKIQGSFRFGAAITNGSPNKQNAFNFVKLLLDDSAQSYFDHRIPVSKKKIKELEAYVPKGNSKVNTDFFKDIEFVNVTTRSDVILSEKMLPYYKGEKSYEECIKEAKEYIEISLSE